MIAFLNRLVSGKNTLGSFVVFDQITKVFEGVTLELPWEDNERGVSCIPAGLYSVTAWDSPTKGRCYRIGPVPGRDNILIHTGNYNKDTQGCILLGNTFEDINKDGVMDVSGSRSALTRLLLSAPMGFMLRVSDALPKQKSETSAGGVTSPAVPS